MNPPRKRSLLTKQVRALSSKLLPDEPFTIPPIPETRIPDDEVDDASVPQEIAVRRAEERYPVNSPLMIEESPQVTIRKLFTQTAQAQFRLKLDGIDPRIGAKLDQPFGKDNLSQCFTSEASLRHVLLPLWWSGYLYDDTLSWDALRAAYYPAQLLFDLLVELGDVDIRGIRGFPTGWESETEVNTNRVQMATAALLVFNGCVADLVRWIGGPHVNAHLDVPQIKADMAKYSLDPRVQQDVTRILETGIPQKCNATSTERNFEAFYRYGNHTTVLEEPAKTYKAMVKDNKRGYTLLLDQRAVLLLLHCHLTPQGVVDLNTPYKNPRPIFDSSFRPFVWCNAINDWTSKHTEPDLTFSTAELGFMIWLYNLRITYPDLEIYIMDDDICGAFRRMKYHPNCMSMHCSIQCGYLVINTGGTFGDNTSPSNFDPVALSRRLFAQALWVQSPQAGKDALKHLPPLEMTPTPSGTIFEPVDPDSINQGVVNADGTRRPPTYDMHVDDALYADVAEYLTHTVGTSVAALFYALGRPDDPRVPSPLSNDKFEASYTHLRKCVGRRFNSRSMTVGLMPYKREQLVALLTEWVDKPSFDLLGIARLLGILENHTRYARWARCWFFSLQNLVRRVLALRFRVMSRRFPEQARRAKYSHALPGSLLARLASIIAADKAKFLWSTKQTFTITKQAREALRYILHYVVSSEKPWEVPIGMIIPRDYHFESRGDASLIGGGAYCSFLGFWFEVAWSPRVLTGTRLASSDPGYVHINTLEFVVILLQLAAIRTRLELYRDGCLPSPFSAGVPHIPVWRCRTDNLVSKSWEGKVTARTHHGQSVLGIYGELLRTSCVKVETVHIPGVQNIVADDISRNDFSLPFRVRSAQLYQKHPFLGTYDIFQPSPTLLQNLTSSLFSDSNPVPYVLPPVLGRFVPASSTTSNSVVI